MPVSRDAVGNSTRRPTDGAAQANPWADLLLPDLKCGHAASNAFREPNGRKRCRVCRAEAQKRRRDARPTQQVVYDCIAKNLTSPSWIAQKTGLTRKQVEDALHQLHAKGRIVKEADGRVRAYHKCLLEKVWR